MKKLNRLDNTQLAFECIYDNPLALVKYGRVENNVQYPHDKAVEEASKVLSKEEYKLYITLARFAPKMVKVMGVEDLATALGFTVDQFNEAFNGLIKRKYLAYRPLFHNDIIYVGNAVRFHDDNSLVAVCPLSRAATRAELNKPYFYTGEAELPDGYLDVEEEEVANED